MQNTILIENKKIDEHGLLPTHHLSKVIGYARIISPPENKKRTRLVVKNGIEHISVLLEDIALFFTQNKIVYVIDHTGKKYISEKNLSELEQELDDSVFFRANHQYIININHIKSFRTYERLKLKIDMKLKEMNEQYCIIISQETAPEFRKWIYLL